MMTAERLVEIRELTEAKRLRGNVPVGYADLRDLLELSDRLAGVLTEIADEDYRGNRSPASEKSHMALVAEGLRS